MKIIVDKNSWQVAKNDGNEYIYVYQDESLSDLMKTKLVCKEPEEIDEADINTTDYLISCKKKCKITEKNWNVLEEKNYKYVVIVPSCNNDRGNYKRKTFFRNCIDSILGQTYKDFKLIIVDDCSNDTSVETVKEYQKKDDRVILIQNKRKRYNGGSRNVGIEYALENLEFD